MAGWLAFLVLTQLDDRALVATLKGHTRAVTAVAFSPRGELLASAGWDNRVRVWKRGETGYEEWATLKAGASGIAFSADGKSLATGSPGTELILWDVGAASVTKRTQLPGHVNRPFAVAFSPTGQHLATGCFDPVLRLWKHVDGEWESWAILANERVPSLGVSSLAFSADGKMLAAGHFAGKQSLRLWDISEQLMLEREIPAAQAHVVAFAADNKSLAFAGDDARIRLWDVSAKPPTSRTLATDAGGPPWKTSVLALAVSPDGRTLASTHKDRTLVLWDIAAAKKRRTIPFIEDCTALRIAPDGQTLAVGNADGSVYILRID